MLLINKKANDNIDLLNMNPVLAEVDFTSQITWSFVMELKQFQGTSRVYSYFEKKKCFTELLQDLTRVFMDLVFYSLIGPIV